MHLRFSLASYPMRLSDVEELQGKYGWMKVSKVAVMAAGTLREELILTCLPTKTINKLWKWCLKRQLRGL